jgi:hypothetical protein
MRARTLTTMLVLGDLKNAFLRLLERQHQNPALLTIYSFSSFSDMCAALASDGKTQNQDITEAIGEAPFSTLPSSPTVAHELAITTADERRFAIFSRVSIPTIPREGSLQDE